MTHVNHRKPRPKSYYWARPMIDRAGGATGSIEEIDHKNGDADQKVGGLTALTTTQTISKGLRMRCGKRLSK